jgi:hypothetical protein
MFTPGGTIKIMDFGLARSGADSSTQMTMVGSVLGTPAYMSPEQATGETVDERSDIFSTGVVAYELLGGTRPFAGDSYSTVLRSILTVEPPEVTHFNPLVPEEVARIVRGMLQKDVGKRTQTVSQVREALEDVIETSGLHRGKDLLREYAVDPEGVATKWRQKRLSRHLDQGLFFENMGLGKIDDALLEFRRVLHLDPDNTVAREHVKKLERDREALIAKAPQAAAPPAGGGGGDDRTLVLTPELAAAAAAAAKAPPAPAAPATPPGASAPPASPPAKAAAPAAPPPPARTPPPAKPPTRPPSAKAGAAPGRKGGLPVPMLASVGVLVVAVVVAGIMMFGGKHENVQTPGTGTPAPTAAAPETPTASTPPAAPLAQSAVAPAAPPAAPSDSAGSSLVAALAAFKGGDYAGAATLAHKTLDARGVPRDDVRTARALLARTVVRQKGAAAGTQAFVHLLKTYPAYRPDPSFTPEERGAFETAKLNLAGTGKAGASPPASAAATTAAAAAPPAALSGATGTVSVKVKPFAESFLVDGTAVDHNKGQFQVSLKAGSHKIGVRHPSLGAHDWTVQVVAGETVSLSHDFTATTGSISVASEPTWAEIYMDGVRIGHTTPWDISPVPPGKHEISLVREGFSAEGGAQTVDLKTGETKTVRFKLKARK